MKISFFFRHVIKSTTKYIVNYTLKLNYTYMYVCIYVYVFIYNENIFQRPKKKPLFWRLVTKATTVIPVRNYNTNRKSNDKNTFMLACLYVWINVHIYIYVCMHVYWVTCFVFICRLTRNYSICTPFLLYSNGLIYIKLICFVLRAHI